MLGRWQPPVLSPVAPATLLRALPAILTRSGDAFDRLHRIIRTRFSADHVALTDSGTSALVLAFRYALPARGTVALPAYACVDLLAAAAFAGLRVRLYDVDPATLSPDLDSVRATLGRGADGIVVAHLYGFPADVPAVASLAAEYGTVVIEDAAQHAAGTLRGKPLGAFGPFVVLSFGRGKGTTGGSGGALLSRDPFPEWQPPAAATGWRDWFVTAAQLAIGRPSLYAIPASMPGLRLGETIYKEAHEPRSISYAAAALAADALAVADGEAVRRTWYARRIIDLLSGTPGLDIVQPVSGGTSGYLRLPVLDSVGRHAAPRLGVVRSYPRPLGEESAASGLLAPGEPATPRARGVCASLFTLPTHARIDEADREQLSLWARTDRSP
ncbi:MAG TPA: DegT/DnrJ/EryC1/StrS family aminotransferase [Gemmatimonadaceae bacterium]|nr:DegT/DnrJ/EryC1/StrS family aminotransferase [Gemmatimonadaceae bacterium]